MGMRGGEEGNGDVGWRGMEMTGRKGKWKGRENGLGKKMGMRMGRGGEKGRRRNTGM